MPLISIIIPVYNVEAYLRACLDSVLSQSISDWECIVIDNASTDTSRAIADSYAAHDQRFRIISLSGNCGPSARNRGLDEARGEYLTFVDSDDTIHPRCLELLVGMMTKGVDIAMTDLTRSPDGFFTGPAPVTIYEPRRAVELCLYQRNGFNPSASGKLYRTSLFSGERFTPDLYYEDLELAPRLWLHSRALAHAPLRLYWYRMRPGSHINTFTPRRLDVMSVTESHVQRFISDTELGPAAADRQLSAAFNMFMLLSTNGMSASTQARECWNTLKRLRRRSLFNRKVRIKNRVGIILSYLLGRRLFARIGKFA